MRMRFPVASQKTALSTTRGGIIAVVTRSANGNKVTVGARVTGEFLGSPLNWTTSSNFPTTRLLHSRFDHDDDISFPRFGR